MYKLNVFIISVFEAITSDFSISFMSVYFQKIKYQKHFYIAEYFGIKQLYVNLRFQ